MGFFMPEIYFPHLTNNSLPVTHEVEVMDEKGRKQTISIPGERSLTIYLDKKEIVTLMTLGAAPEALVLGYLKNQNLIDTIENIESIQVDWETDSAAVRTIVKKNDIEALTSKRVVTSGCGQGTMFGEFMADLDRIQLPTDARLNQVAINQIIEKIRQHPSIYKQAGSVHACAVFEVIDNNVELLYFIEDVGRHNAVDAITGLMWLDRKDGRNLVFYTTGRLTSEMVIKGGQMGIPFLMTRSGATQMGLELAKKINLTLLARCSGTHFLIYEGQDRIQLQQENT